MALHFILEEVSYSAASAIFSAIDEYIEVFEINTNQVGISIPTKVLDYRGEENMQKILAQFQHYDLWQGKWSER